MKEKALQPAAPAQKAPDAERQEALGIVRRVWDCYRGRHGARRSHRSCCCCCRRPNRNRRAAAAGNAAKEGEKWQRDGGFLRRGGLSNVTQLATPRRGRLPTSRSPEPGLSTLSPLGTREKNVGPTLASAYACSYSRPLLAWVGGVLLVNWSPKRLEGY